ncbi:hypothetical protein [Pseudanabaena sp. FACHB-2040]|uniref:hypothetical protein n=1 Tax=Pseudanabaena sp. FACHB-2040 TaxID=2692859 RepID=UPI0016874749|nr:hypothetical protein [Pseudanabaena sp. FACHB-2040]MBD2260718.1 hypothetical protein [Pseudanabaena sp. FACHB-2040]
MQLNVSKSSAVSSSWQPSRSATKPASSLQVGKWVRLSAPISPFSHDEALLLCREPQNRWVVWVPGHGEATVDASQLG